MKKELLTALLVVTLFAVAALPAGTAFARPGAAALPQAEPPAPPKPTPEKTENGAPLIDEEAIRQAVAGLTSADGQKSPAFSAGYALDEIFASQDGSQAVLWLAPIDPETGLPLATEPTLAIGTLDASAKLPGAAQVWRVTIQTDAGWEEARAGLALELQNPDLLGEDPGAGEKAPAAPTATYGGYLLPWANGLTKRLSMGANHVSCSTRCTYAFDFADGTMFPMLASKGGIVYHFSDSCPNGSTGCTNSITLEDRSTTPWTYQIYLHLRQGSIPTELRQVGAQVLQGQYIGDVDDTGYSSGHHVHFMVVAQSSLFFYSDYYWGNSVDITFKDVSINWDAATGGGRPCLGSDVGYGKCSQYQSSYTSGNQGTNPPSGDLVLPVHNILVSEPTVMVAGWGVDDRQVVKQRIIANWDGTWNEVGPAQTGQSFAFPLDLCDANIPEGPVSLALRVWDMEGNQSVSPLGVRSIVKKSGCAPAAPPTCTVSSDQAALFSEPNFGGSCKVFGQGSYASGSALGAVGDNQAASIKVGQNVVLTLFDGINFSGRAESFTSDYGTPTLLDRNLDDNVIGSDMVSSIKIQARTQKPAPPVINALTGITTRDSIVFSWNSAGGSTKFQAELLDGNGNRMNVPGQKNPQDWSAAQSWSVGNLSAGVYTLQVTGRVTNYASSPTPVYSDPARMTFTVSPAEAFTSESTYPLASMFETGPEGWYGSGLWRHGGIANGENPANLAWIFNNGADYNTSPLSGDLTSPRLVLPSGGPIYLRFNYLYGTESAQPNFDQRRVQITEAGVGYTDLLQLSDDPQGVWLNSPVIDLTQYAGKTIRLRFHFDALDPVRNAATGWVIDNVNLSATPPPVCSDANNTIAAATQITVGTPAAGVLCPAGDRDFYKFSATANQRIQVDIVSANPHFDPLLTLLDSDGTSVIAENDDIVPYKDPNSRVSFIVPATGTYYLKVRAWNHPGVGAPEYSYAVSATRQTDTTAPALTLSYPYHQGYLTGGPVKLAVQASDAGSGMKSVDFWHHSPDMGVGVWSWLGRDLDGSDGWTLDFDSASLVDGKQYSFYARASDWAGNEAIDAALDVGIDRTVPTSTLLPLPGTFSSTRVRLQWQASDTGSGIHHYDVEFSTDGGATWQPSAGLLSGGSLLGWFTGEVGKTYLFRTRAVDGAGNAEPYPDGGAAEASTTVTGCSPDGSETNDTAATATRLAVEGPEQRFNICSAGDVDYYQFEAIAGKTYMIMALPGSESMAALQATLQQPGGAQTVLSGPALGGLPGQPIIQFYHASTSGTVTLRISDLDARTAGDLASYSLWVGYGSISYLPGVYR